MERPKTIEECDQKLIENPDKASIYYDRGLLYLHQKAWVEARVDFKTFVELRPEVADGYNNLAITYFHSQEYDKAEACWEAAGQRDPKSSLYFKNRILSLEKLKNYTLALSLLNERILSFPREPENYLSRAHFLGLNGQYIEQLRDLSKALEISPNLHSVRARRVLLLGSLGNKQKAEEELRLLMPVFNSIDVSLQRPLILLATRYQQNECILALTRVYLPAHPDDLELIHFAVQAALVLKKYDLALSYLSKGWETIRNDLLLLERASLYLEMHKEDLALQDLVLYRQHAGPDLQQAWLQVRAYLQLQDWTKALTATETMLDLDPDHLEGLQKKAIILAHLERFEEASIAFEKLSKREPLNPSVFYNLGLCHLTLGHEKYALDSFSKTLLLQPGNLDARANRANIYLKQKLWKLASSDFRLLLEKQTENAEYWLNFATSEFHEGHLPESREHYAKAKSLDPKLNDYEYHFGEWVK